jgi:hypothetical protein
MDFQKLKEVFRIKIEVEEDDNRIVMIFQCEKLNTRAMITVNKLDLVFPLDNVADLTNESHVKIITDYISVRLNLYMLSVLEGLRLDRVLNLENIEIDYTKDKDLVKLNEILLNPNYQPIVNNQLFTTI